MFFVEHGKQILDLLNAIIDSITAIAKGQIAAAAAWVEKSLARTIPVIIGFLAALLGVGGITEKIKEIIEAIRKPINEAIDWVINKAVDLVKAVGGLLGFGKEEKKDKADEKQDLDVEEAFSMKDAGHSLHVSTHADKLVVEMASGRREILENLTAVAIYNEEKGAKRKTLLKRLNRVHDELKDMQWNWNAAQNKGDEEKRELIKKRLGEIANNLMGIGIEFGITDLASLGHPSKYVEGNTLKEEHRAVRTEFYPTKYRGSTDTWKAAQLLKLRVSPVPGKTNPDPANPGKYFWCVETGDFVPVEEATIDHKPWVVQHWNDLQGNNMNQQGRADFYNDTSGDMRVIARSKNSSDGHEAKLSTGGYKFTVGPNFRGPADEEV